MATTQRRLSESPARVRTAGKRWRTASPRAVGATIRITISASTRPAGTLTTLRGPESRHVRSTKAKVTVRTPTRLLTAVRVTDSATLPPTRSVYVFDPVPAGQAAARTTPKATGSGTERAPARKAASGGRRTAWASVSVAT